MFQMYLLNEDTVSGQLSDTNIGNLKGEMSSRFKVWETCYV